MLHKRISIKKPLRRLFFSLGQILFAAVLIGLLHEFHLLLTLLIGGIVIGRGWRAIRQGDPAYVAGLSVAFLVGALCEYAGTSAGYWTYYGQPDELLVPLWVPFAWSAAYAILYRMEEALFSIFKPSTIFAQLPIIVVPSLVAPVLGEMVAISFGTWEYHWQPQLLGMPAQAAFLLCFTHCVIFFTMREIYRTWNRPDPVYGG